MGVGCCQKKASLTYEDVIRQSIIDLKICQETLINLKVKLTQIYGKKKFIEKSLLLKYLARIFYDTDHFSNPQIKIHKRIFEEVFNCMNEKINQEEILLMLFPLLNFNNTEKDRISDEFAEIYFKFHGEGLASHENVYQLFIKIYELYTFKLTKIYQMLNENIEITKKLVLMNKYIFNFKNLNVKVLKMLKSLETRNKEENNIDIIKFKNNFREKSLLLIHDIRDYLLDNFN